MFTMPNTKSELKAKQGIIKSPNNSRNIPDEVGSIWSKGASFMSREWKLMLGSFIIGLLLMAIFYVGIDIYVQRQILAIQNQKREALLSEIATWETIVSSHQDYRDGHFQLALLYYQIGDTQRAQESLRSTLYIDPNFQKAREFEKQFYGGQ